MKSTFLFIFITLFASAAFVTNAQAQIDASTPSGRTNPAREELPKSIKENLKKHQIKRDQKKFEDMLKDGEEAVKLSEELELSLNQNNRFVQDDIKKLERLEKLVKNIRQELGGADDKEEEKSSLDFQNAVLSLKDKVVDLFEELKKMSRHSISAAAIQSSNSILKLVRFLRFVRN